MARRVLLLALLLASTALALRAMGRSWWCGAGDYALWSGDVWSRHNSQHLVDPYTVTHVLHGFAVYFLLWAALRRFATPFGRAAIGTMIEAAWEIVENTSTMIERYRATTISLDYYGDSVANSLGDFVAFIVGYVAAGLLPVWVSAIGFFVVDGLMILWIRDSLLLNVVMLIYPLESVKTWQFRGSPGQ